MVKKKVSKSAKKPSKKKVTKKAVVSKTVKKQLASNKKATTKALSHNKIQDKEIEKLKIALANFKKKNKDKKNTKRVSEYNLFIRKQIKSGLTFERAVKEWNKYKALENKQKRRPSAYNQFIGSQMRLGKTFTQAVALWKLAKAGKLGRKGTTKTVEKIKYKTRTIKSKPKVVVRRVKSKPTVVEKIKYRNRKPKVVEKIKYRTRKVSVEKPVKTKVISSIDYNKLSEVFSGALSTSMKKVETISKQDISSVIEADDEEIAFKIVQTYFKEIARFGFKKQLTLDEIIDGYLYALARVKRNEHKELEVSERVRKSGMKK